MAVLLVSMSIAAIMLTVAMPVWKQMSQREKEEELIFRGTQYARAIRLFGMKYANAYPPNLDVLLEQRFLRKKYKDPITNDDFQPILAGQNVPGAPGTTTGQRGASPTQTGRGGGPTTAAGPTTGGPTGGGAQATGRGATTTGPTGPTGLTGSTLTAGATAGIMGVASKSKDTSIRIYNGRTHYNEWAFVATQQTQTPGVGAPGTGAPGTAAPGATGPGGRGRQGQPTSPFSRPPDGSPFPPGRQGGPPSPFGPGRGGASPFGPQSPFQPAQPIQPGRGRGNLP